MYDALWLDAEDILMGFRKVYTFDAEVADYYKKVDVKTDNIDEIFLPVAASTASEFIAALYENGVLYERIMKVNEDGSKEPLGPANGYLPSLGVTTLEEYYSWIKTLGNIDRKYTMLPLDEEHFEINTNTRAITVPTSFKKNGIAVQGDELAEIVYFKVDRYFDYIDLNNTNIFIQWEAPKNAEGKVVRGVSPEYVRDISSEPGKLIFGWAISEDITRTAGALKVSVRFFEYMNDDKKQGVEYSLSTLTSTVNIHPGLNYDLVNDDTILVDDVGERVINRLEDGVVVGGYLAGEPEFIINLATEADLSHAEGQLWDENSVLVLEAQAISPDAGDITYTWKVESVDKFNPEVKGDIRVLEGVNVYRPVEKADLVAGRSYYYTVPNAPNVYLHYKQAIPAADSWTYPLFEKVSRCTVNSVGKYWVEALNRVGYTTNDESSLVCLVPTPTPVANIVSPEARITFLQGESAEFEPAVLTASAGNTDGILTYEWFYSDNKDLNFGEGPAPDWDAMEPLKDEDGNVITAGILEVEADAEGHYRAMVYNNRNKEELHAWTEVSRVTKPAALPQVLPLDVNADKYNDTALTDENCPTITLDASKPVYSDGYTITWYKWVDEKADGTWIGYEVWPEEDNKFKFNPKRVEESVFTDNNDEQGIFGDYYAKITNHVNGSSASIFSERYSVI